MSITLHSENYEVTINRMGAELKSFRTTEGKEFIWNSDPAFWMRSSPLLFPTIGNVRNNETRFDGVSYPLPKHGFCKDSEFTPVDVSADKVTFVLNANEETLAVYPFRFSLALTYELKGNMLHMTYTVTNTDSKDMPYHIGAHPGFMCPLESDEDFSDYQLVFEKEEALVATPYDLDNLCFYSDRQMTYAANSTTLPLNKEMFKNDAIFFPNIVSRSVRLEHATRKHGIRVDYPDFRTIAFWTPIGGKAPFLCIEPWNGSAIYDDEDDNFTSKRNLETLAPNASKSYRLTISLLGY